jgi:hypothetical protein
MEPGTVEKKRASRPRTRDPGLPPGPPADMAPLIGSLRTLPERLGAIPAFRLAKPSGQTAFHTRTGFRPRGGTPVIVVGKEVALELGHPDTESQAALVWTAMPGLVTDGLVTRCGPDVGALPRGARWPFGLLVSLELDPGVPSDPFAMEQLLNLTNRLPGYMVRALPGRLWARIGANALDRGLSLFDVGEALVRAFGEEVQGVRAVEALLVTASAEAVRLLAPLVAEARILAGQHKKLALSPEGDLECEELDCDECDDRDTCDSLRDILARRRAAGGGAASFATRGGHG